jgi:hypothetical protein
MRSFGKRKLGIAVNCGDHGDPRDYWLCFFGLVAAILFMFSIARDMSEGWNAPDDYRVVGTATLIQRTSFGSLQYRLRAQASDGDEFEFSCFHKLAPRPSKAFEFVQSASTSRFSTVACQKHERRHYKASLALLPLTLLGIALIMRQLLIEDKNRELRRKANRLRQHILAAQSNSSE